MIMMQSIAEAAMAMKATQFSTAYSTAMMKKSMESQEAAAQLVTEMLASVPSPARVSDAQFIDTYA